MMDEYFEISLMKTSKNSENELFSTVVFPGLLAQTK